MIDITFTFRITQDSLEILSAEYPDEYRVAWGFFQEQGAEKHQDEIQLIYDFLIGEHSDWLRVSEALKWSPVYESAQIWAYLAKTPNYFPSADDLRQAIQSYAQDNFTSAMLIQETPDG